MGDNKTQPNAQAGRTSQASGVAGEVGVPHSSVDLQLLQRVPGAKGDTYSMRGGEAKDTGMAGATRIVTPNKVRSFKSRCIGNGLYALAEHGGMESRPMNKFGEPNRGNLSVPFDEGWERAGHWPLAFQPILSRLHYNRIDFSNQGKREYS